MKKIVSLFLVSAMLILMTLPTSAEVTRYDEARKVIADPLNNALYDVIATIHDAQSAQGEIYAEDLIYDYVPVDETTSQKKYTLKTTYMDGSLVTKSLGVFPSLTDLYFPDMSFVDFSDIESTDEYILTENLNHRFDLNIYKIKIENETVTSREIKYTTREQADNSFIINKATENNGEIVEEYYKTISYDEMLDYIYGSSSYDTFNDGLIYNRDYHLVDINDEVFYYEYQETYHNTNYNLGYLNENYNNGYMLDWSLPDAEKYLTYDTTVYDVFSGDSFYFENSHLEPIDDYGYSILTINVDENKTQYLIKLKRPAIVTVFLDGAKIGFDQLPVIEDGRTLVPLRAIFDALGAEIAWDGNTQTVTATKDDTTISLTIDNTIATKNGQEITLDVPAKLVNGRTLVPVRFIADCFGVTTDWDGEMQRVLLTSN